MQASPGKAGMSARARPVPGCLGEQVLVAAAILLTVTKSADKAVHVHLSCR